jgi:PhnB protein
MSFELVPYLNFPPGRAGEAMRYYADVFGGTLDVTNFGEFAMEGMPADGVMHAHLKAGSFQLMASDAMEGAESTWGGTRVYLAFIGDNLDEVRGYFERLGADGSVGVALEKQPWGDTYGLVMDKYGIEWMFDIGEPE